MALVYIASSLRDTLEVWVVVALSEVVVAGPDTVISHLRIKLVVMNANLTGSTSDIDTRIGRN